MQRGRLARPGSYALDPGLPLAAGSHQTPVGRALFGAFSDGSPDRWGRAPWSSGARPPWRGSTDARSDRSADTASLTLAMSVADYFRLPASQAAEVVEQVQAAIARWPHMARRHGLTSAEIAEMAWAFTAHQKQT